MRASTLVLSFSLLVMLNSQQSLAQKPTGLPNSYPMKPVSVIIGTAPGGSSDTLGRLVFRHLGEAWGHPFVVENRGSVQGSALALEYVSKQPADGYTLDAVAGGTYIGAVAHNLPKNVLKVIDPVAQFTSQAFLLVTTGSLPANTVLDLVAIAKNSPDKLNYASPGFASVGHLVGEYLKHEYKINMTHVPYKGIALAYSDLLAGRTQLTFASSIVAGTFAKNGSVKILAATSAKRLHNFPDVPTIGESVPGFEFISFTGVVAPSGVPRPIINALNNQVNQILQKADVKKGLEADGSIVTPGTPEAFHKTLETLVRRVDSLIFDAKLDLREAK